MPNFSHIDHSHRDTYVIELGNHGEFVYCLRYVFGGNDPIHYDELENIPLPHREAIEYKIQNFNHGHR